MSKSSGRKKTMVGGTGRNQPRAAYMEIAGWAQVMWICSPERSGPLVCACSDQARSQGGFYLDFPKFSSALHAAGNIDRVSPNVILRFPCPNHACDHRTMVYT